MINLFVITEIISNPYSALGGQFTSGMASIEGALVGSDTFDNLVGYVYNYISGVYYPSPTAFDIAEINSIIPNASNSYINAGYQGYNMAQGALISSLVNGILNTPVESIGDFISSMEGTIQSSGLSLQETAPLFMATAIGTATYNYWLSVFGTSNNWYTYNYLNTNDNTNRASLPYWVHAAIIGTLVSANKAKTYGQIDPPQVVGVDMVSALTGSLGVAAGKVMFQWIPKINPVQVSLASLYSNQQVINNPNNNGGHMGLMNRAHIQITGNHPCTAPLSKPPVCQGFSNVNNGCDFTRGGGLVCNDIIVSYIDAANRIECW